MKENLLLLFSLTTIFFIFLGTTTLMIMGGIKGYQVLININTWWSYPLLIAYMSFVGAVVLIVLKELSEKL